MDMKIERSDGWTPDHDGVLIALVKKGLPPEELIEAYRREAEDPHRGVGGLASRATLLVRMGHLTNAQVTPLRRYYARNRTLLPRSKHLRGHLSERPEARLHYTADEVAARIGCPVRWVWTHLARVAVRRDWIIGGTPAVRYPKSYIDQHAETLRGIYQRYEQGEQVTPGMLPVWESPLAPEGPVVGEAAAAQRATLHRALVLTFPKVPAARIVVRAAGIPVGGVRTDEGVEALWDDALDLATENAMGHLRAAVAAPQAPEVDTTTILNRARGILAGLDGGLFTPLQAVSLLAELPYPLVTP